jgi:hypothetical protein
MAAHQDSTLWASQPDPYADDPLSWTRVIFRTVPRWPEYGADTLGVLWTRLRSNNNPCGDWMPLTPWRNPSGHLMVWFYRRSKRHPQLVHRLILETFIGPAPEGLECCHNNGIPGDNRLSNLRWDTSSSNAADAIHHGTWPIGEKHWNSKLTDQDVSEILDLCRQGVSLRSIARLYAVDKSTIRRIVNGERWKHVEIERGVIPRKAWVNPLKLSRDEIAEVRRLLDTGLSQRKIGFLFGVSQAYISRIKLNVIK